MTTTSINIAGLDVGPVTLTSEQLDDMDSKVAGRLLRAGDDGWDDALLVWNGMTARLPALVLQPTSAHDVATAVAFAGDHGLLLSVKGGGHNIAGTSIAEGGLMLDMSRMREVTVDPGAKLAHVGPGCLLKEVDQATQGHGLATVLGFISEVGVAGLTLGGGLGYLTRRFGWTVDNLEEVEIVTADSRIRRASREENPELFWGIRGGGANLGVVTRFTFRLHQLGPTVYGGLIAWPFERADEVMAAYRTITTQAPRGAGGVAGSAAGPCGAIRARGVAWPADLRHGRLLQRRPRRRRRGAGADPGAGRPGRGSAGPPAVYRGPVLPRRRRAQGPALLLEDRVPRRAERRAAVDHAGAVRLLPPPGRRAGLPAPRRRLNDRDGDDGAVGNRDARFVLGINGMWAADEPEADSFRQWIRDAWERVRPYSTGGTYINFQTADEDQERIRATYGANFDRLVEVKQRYDPGNLFRANRNIRPHAASERRPGS